MAGKLPSIQVAPVYMGGDVQWNARNWTLDLNGTGTYRRQLNRAEAIEQLTQGINHLLSMHPMPVFQKCQPYNKLQTSSMDPLYMWMLDDSLFYNLGKEYVVKILAFPRLLAAGYPGYSYGIRYGSTEDTPEFYMAIAGSPTQPWPHVFETYYDVEIDSPSMAVAQDGVTTGNGFAILSVSVEQRAGKYPMWLNTADVSGIYPGNVKTGNVVQQGKLEEISTRMHQLRSFRIGVALSWCATGFTAQPVSPGDQTGLHVQSATYVNVFNQAETTRTHSSVGATLNVQYGGVGPSDEVHGQRVKVLCRAYCESVGGDSTIKFIGPEHLANNYTEITIPSGFKGWVGDETNYVYLNPNAEPDDMTTSCNKIDVHGKTAGTSLFIYALRGLRAYP